MFMKPGRAAEPQEAWGMKATRTASLPSACSLPFFKRLPLRGRKHGPTSPEPVALATRERNHFLQPQLANVPGRGSTGQGHRWVMCHLSRVQLQSGEQGMWLGSKRVEEFSEESRHHIQKGEVLSWWTLSCPRHALPLHSQVLFLPLCLCLLNTLTLLLSVALPWSFGL